MSDNDDDSANDNVLRFPHFIRLELNKQEREHRAKFGPNLLGCYRLVGRTPVPVDSSLGWAMEFERRHESMHKTGIDPWRVAFTVIGNAEISTVFLGLDHNFSRNGPPVLFETMVFGGQLDDFQNRCCTWEEAEAMHEEALQLVRTGHLKVIK